MIDGIFKDSCNLLLLIQRVYTPTIVRYSLGQEIGSRYKDHYGHVMFLVEVYKDIYNRIKRLAEIITKSPLPLLFCKQYSLDYD